MRVISVIFAALFCVACVLGLVYVIAFAHWAHARPAA